MERFTAYLLVRRFLKRRESRNRALAVEAIMEELASELGAATGQAGASWGAIGLLSQLDLEYAEHNPDVRGVAAQEQARLEGLDPALARCLLTWHDPDAGEPSALESALLIADHLASAALQDRSGLPEQTVDGLARELELQRGAGDPVAERLDRALTKLPLTSTQAAAVAMRALSRVAEELR